jgi:L-ascorbate metabolism protein UlaG (beta-lactamase superfamily)
MRIHFERAGLILALMVWPGVFQAVHAEGLSVERLSWAGVRFVSGNATVFVDAVGGGLWDGRPPEGLAPVSAETERRYALLTHVHNDHFDAEALKQVLGERGTVMCHESAAIYVASRGLKVTPVAMFEPVVRGDFTFVPVPAEDGFGDEQVSWIVSVAGKRFFHGGDTLWHGHWQTIGTQYGPFDAAFLPINGARIQADPMPETSAVLTPAQAVDAAIMLRAQKIVPIHFGFNDPPAYVEVENPLPTLIQNAQRRGLAVEHLRPGAVLTLED